MGDLPTFHKEGWLELTLEPKDRGTKVGAPLNPRRCVRNVSKTTLQNVKAPNARTSLLFLIQTEVPLSACGIWVKKSAGSGAD